MANPAALPVLISENTPPEIQSIRSTWDTERDKISNDLNTKLNLSLQVLEGELKGEQAAAVLAYRETMSIPEVVPVSPPKVDIAKSEIARATKARPFINSLRMKFVPVPITGGPTDGQRVLFSIWETRVADYEKFAKTKGSRDHPVKNVSWEDATAFCEWLTEEDLKKGKISKQDHYRLPTDHEWSCAVGIGKQEDAERQPRTKDTKIANVYPWGKQWPPPKEAGNFSEKLRANGDGFANTAPVGSFAPNQYGLYDLAGNLWEWCADWFSIKQEKRVMRGAAWINPQKHFLLSSNRSATQPSSRYVSFGFRCVLHAGENRDIRKLLTKADRVPTPQINLKDAIKAYYTFDAEDKLGIDSSGSLPPLTPQQCNITWSHEGVTGGAASFDGKDSILKLGKIMSLKNQSLTISCWLKTTSKQEQEVFVFGARATGLALFTDNQSVGFAYRWGKYKNLVEIKQTIPRDTEGKWFHVCATCGDTGNITLWVNGEKEGPQPGQPISDNPTAGGNLGTVLHLNNNVRQSKTTNPYNGLIDEFIMLDRALTDIEVAELYSRHKPPA